MRLVLRTSVLFVFNLCAFSETFSLPCGTPPPLRSILKAIDQTEPTAIDASCAADGGSDQTAKKIESKAKNSFCATDLTVECRVVGQFENHNVCSESYREFTDETGREPSIAFS